MSSKPGFLLDVNVLIAMAWPSHGAHQKIQSWFSTHASADWATCPLTQTAFVRLLSNPAFSPNALTPTDALSLLQANLVHPRHKFWTDELDLRGAVGPFGTRITGHKQITDAYLLGLAMHNRGKLVILDRSIAALLPERNGSHDCLEVI